MANDINAEILSEYSMLDKVAIFCLLIGEEATIKIFKNLSLELVEKISSAIAQLQSVDKEVSLAVLNEFYLFTKTNAYIRSGGFPFAKDLLYKSLGKKEADSILNKLSQFSQSKVPFAYLDSIDPRQLAEFIKDESPQTMAVILSHMDPVRSSELVETLDEDMKVKVSMQMATIKDVSPEIVRTLSNVLEKKLESLLSHITQVGGVKVVADMLNRMGPKAQDILKNIDGVNNELARNIKENMFVFDDMMQLETADLMKVLAEIDIGDLVVAFKAAPDEHLESLKNAMSQRVKTRFDDEYELLGKIKVRDIEAAQRKMLEVAQRLIENGEIERDLDE